MKARNALRWLGLLVLAGSLEAKQAPAGAPGQVGGRQELGRVWLVGGGARVAMPSIQAAVDAADEGDEVVLSNGLFRGAGNRGVVVRDRNLKIRAEEGATPVLDCQGLARGFWFDGPAIDGRTVLHGLWIRDGNSLPSPLNGSGGGVLVTGGAHPTISATTVEGCREHGIAYFYDDAGGTLPLGQVQDCRFLGNRSDGDGGGFWGGAVVVERCTFLGNTAGVNGGAARITHVLRDSLVAGNAATNAVNSAGGVLTWIDARVEGCTFVGNSANYGGGLTMYPGTTEVSNCVFWGNTALFGGAQLWQGAPTFGATATVVRYCDVQGGAAGIGTDPKLSNGPLLEELLDEDPLFLDPAAGDWRLGPGSPCLDAGDPLFATSGRGDVELQPRVAGGRVDLGADERWETFVLGLVSPGASGLPNRVRADDGPPGALVSFFWGTSPGTFPVPLPGCPSLALAIADPLVLAMGVVDAKGSASFAQGVPASLAGSTVLLQALYLGGAGCGASNLVTHTYP